MKTSVFLFFFLLTLSVSAQKESETPLETFSNKNGIQLELYGQGGYYSLRYERILYNRRILKGGLSIGGSYNFPESTNAAYISSFMAEYAFIIHLKDGFHLELSYGVAVWVAETTIPEVRDYDYLSFMTGRVGVRYQPNNARYSVRAGASPLIASGLDGLFLYRAVYGVIVGYHF